MCFYLLHYMFLLHLHGWNEEKPEKLADDEKRADDENGKPDIKELIRTVKIFEIFSVIHNGPFCALKASYIVMTLI